MVVLWTISTPTETVPGSLFYLQGLRIRQGTILRPDLSEPLCHVTGRSPIYSPWRISSRRSSKTRSTPVDRDSRETSVLSLFSESTFIDVSQFTDGGSLRHSGLSDSAPHIHPNHGWRYRGLFPISVSKDKNDFDSGDVWVWSLPSPVSVSVETSNENKWEPFRVEGPRFFLLRPLPIFRIFFRGFRRTCGFSRMFWCKTTRCTFT